MKLFPVISVALSLLTIVNAAPLNFTKRRFGQEHTPEADATYQAMKDLTAGTTFSEALGNLSGAAVRALLAKAPKCDQQDVADECVDKAKEMIALGLNNGNALIKVCQTYRTLERNTPNPGQPSELCDKPPKNQELEGLTQRQDPTGSSTDPTNPDPTNPDPTNPDPTNPDPTNPDPTNPDPTDPNPTDPEVEGNPNNEAFSNPVGGVQMPLITKLAPGSGANFEVNGNQFQQIGAAQNRQCDIQHNLCFNKFNAGDRTFEGSDCDEQNNVCKAGDPVFAKSN